MSKLNIQERAEIGLIIQAVLAGDIVMDDLCVYAEEDVGEISQSLACYLDRYPEIVDDTEVHSDFVCNNNLELLYYGQQFKDVVDHVYDQKPSATLGDVIAALNYYMDHDDFLGFD
ncbi:MULTISPECIES: hypothetical protein [unclassified Pseudomonas]|jgi:hypothetical protein|uniref:DUF7716 domain-containing protein n=1 Tax=unclassified Pseudomonas TaxID=196821 RepID=UPI00255375E0|nr:hypothetical protein [Pseudomonas sp. efr-133-TYG-103a]